MRITYPAGLIAVLLVTAAMITACGTDASGAKSGGTADRSSQVALPGSAEAIPVVSLAMEDYLGSTVVLYFSFPG